MWPGFRWAPAWDGMRCSALPAGKRLLVTNKCVRKVADGVAAGVMALAVELVVAVLCVDA